MTNDQRSRNAYDEHVSSEAEEPDEPKKCKVRIVQYVKRAKYGPNHERCNETHGKVHVSLDCCNTTACGKELDRMWIVVAPAEITCNTCWKAIYQ